MLRLGLANIMDPEPWQRLKDLIADIQGSDQNHFQVTLDIRHQRGGVVRGLINLSLVGNQTDGSPHLLLHIQDVSNLVRTQSELEESRQRYRALSDATFEAVFISRKGTCIDANRSASTMFDIPREELIGIFGADVIAPEYKSRVEANMLSGYEAPYHAVALKKDGTRFHVMIQGKMIHLGDSPVRVTVVRDIDAQVKAEAALRESERHLRSLMESASNFILFRMRYDPENPCQPQSVFISPSIAEIVDRTQVVDFQSWLKLIHPDDKAILLDAGRRMLETRRLEERIRIADPSGSGWRWLHIISVAVSDEADMSLFFNGIILDMSREMEATEALQARERELKERTERLSEVNTALGVLLEKREADRSELEEKMLTNAKSLILPYLEKLRASQMDGRQRIYLDIVETNLNEILSPLTPRMSRHFLNFTPLEIQVANLVKAGKSTKDIASALGLSTRTIEAVRYAIRRKLGIKKKRANLRTVLLSIDDTHHPSNF
jgi:PAS domain S-box-containing protein